MGPRGWADIVYEFDPVKWQHDCSSRLHIVPYLHTDLSQTVGLDLPLLLKMGGMILS